MKNLLSLDLIRHKEYKALVLSIGKNFIQIEINNKMNLEYCLFPDFKIITIGCLNIAWEI